MASLYDSFAFENPGSALYGALRNQGIDPTSSYLGGAIKKKGSLFPSLLNYSTFGPGDAEAQAIPMANQFVSGLLGRGENPMAGGNIQNLIGRFTNAAPNSEAFSVLHTGDLAKDYNAWQGMRDLELANSNPLYAGARRGLDERTFAEFAAKFAQGALDPNARFAEQILGRQQLGMLPSTVDGGTPAPATPAPVGPPAVTPPAPATPPAPTPTPGTPGAPPSNAVPPAAPAPAAINTLAALLDRFRKDQRNWGTEGYRPGAPVDIQIGNERFKYDPRGDQVRDWRNMSGSGRTTHRGNFLGQMLYYLNLLDTQRKGAGNAQLGITGASSDADILRIAAQRMGGKAVGNTGWQYSRSAA